MARGGSTALVWRSCEGRNGYDLPSNVPSNMGVEALNVELRRGMLGKKRPGSAGVVITGDTFSGAVHLAKFTPGQDESLVELFIVSNDATTKILRIAGGAAAANLTLKDNFSSQAIAHLVSTVAINGKLIFAYDSAVNRLHAYDPATSTTAVRRLGLATPAAPTVANTGAGAYAAELRYYRVQYRVKSGSVVLYQSNLGASVSFTPSGAGTAARVTKPASISEAETHWAIHASTDDVVYYELAEVAVGTTTYDDSAAITSYDDNDASPIEGSFFPLPSAKFLGTNGSRLFLFGAWETAAGDSVVMKAGTVYFSAPIGSSVVDSTVGAGDEERLISSADQDNWVELSPNGGGVDRGVSGPVFNEMYFFQSKGIYKLVDTGAALAPYRRVVVSKEFGSVSHWSQVIGEDETGQECLYFLNPTDGPRRIKLGAGIEWLGKDVADIWSTINLSASVRTAHGVYDREKKQVKWWVAVNGETLPDTVMIVYHVMLGRTITGDDSIRCGWAKWTGDLAKSVCSLMFPTTLAASRPVRECAYVGNASGVGRQDGSANMDASVPYRGYVKSRAWDHDVIMRRKRVMESYVVATAHADVEIQQTIETDYGARSFAESVNISPETPTQTMVRKEFQGVDINDAIVEQVTVGDPEARDTALWSIDQWALVVEVQEGAK